ncbi:PD-(D/E)XK nuclease family protein, partial [bacterium]|nr:PD-(D/E)XK nuclease family protein [candidate division CSSED10-310 bacterium]
AVGMSFDHLFLPGLTRGDFPRKARTDPVLPEEIRAVLRPVLPGLAGTDDTHRLERFLFGALLASAMKSVTLSYTRSDEDGKPVSPSIFLQELQYRKRLAVPWVVPRNTRQRLRRQVVERGDTTLSPRESTAYLALLQGASVMSDALTGEPELGGLRCGNVQVDWSRLIGGIGRFDWTEELNELDRLSHPIPGYPPATIWATALERLVWCPYRYYLGDVLGIEALEEPQKYGIEPREEGLIVHGILEALGDGAPEESAAAAMVSAALARHAATRVTGLPGLWRLECERITSYLLKFFRFDRQLRRQWRVVAAERSRHARLRFLDGLEVELAARIDRMERDRDTGLIRMLDFKTGSSPGSLSALTSWMLTGRGLQAAVYMLLQEESTGGVLEERSPGAVTGRAGYLYVKADEPLIELDADTWLEGDKGYSLRTHVLRTARLALSLLSRGVPVIRAGEHCRYCAVTRACRRLEFAARYRAERDADSYLDLFRRLVGSGKSLLQAHPSALDTAYKGLFRD